MPRLLDLLQQRSGVRRTLCAHEDGENQGGGQGICACMAPEADRNRPNNRECRRANFSAWNIRGGFESQGGSSVWRY